MRPVITDLGWKHTTRSEVTRTAWYLYRLDLLEAKSTFASCNCSFVTAFHNVGLVRWQRCAEAEGCAERRYPGSAAAAGYAAEEGKTLGEPDGGARCPGKEERLGEQDWYVLTTFSWSHTLAGRQPTRVLRFYLIWDTNLLCTQQLPKQHYDERSSMSTPSNKRPRKSRP